MLCEGMHVLISVPSDVFGVVCYVCVCACVSTSESDFLCD